VTTAFGGVRPSRPVFLQLLYRYRYLSNRAGLPRHLHCSVAAMKRKDPPSKAQQPPKKARIELPEYYLTPSVIEADGSVQWPAPKHEIHRARQIIREWQVYIESS